MVFQGISVFFDVHSVVFLRFTQVCYLESLRSKKACWDALDFSMLRIMRCFFRCFQIMFFNRRRRSWNDQIVGFRDKGKKLKDSDNGFSREGEEETDVYPPCVCYDDESVEETKWIDVSSLISFSRVSILSRRLELDLVRIPICRACCSRLSLSFWISTCSRVWWWADSDDFILFTIMRFLLDKSLL